MTGHVTIYTDGACKGNPGPGGWGLILLAGGAEKELFGGDPDTTNNRMEMMAAIKALQTLSRPCSVELYTDSQYVIKGCTEWLVGWKKRNWRKSDKSPVENVDLWKLLDEQLGRHDIKFHWVRGHSGDKYNERADQLANQGVDLVRGQAAERSTAPKPQAAQGALNLAPKASGKPTVEAYTDGSSRKSGAGGWAVVLVNQGVESEQSGGAHDTTNNRMEMMGPIIALETIPAHEHVRITTDSQYVQKGIEEWIHNWKKRGWRTADNKPVKNVDLWQRLDKICAGREITWAWVRGHSGHHYNERADELAGEASLKAQASIPAATLS
jgi:ribonuclease HI